MHLNINISFSFYLLLLDVAPPPGVNRAIPLVNNPEANKYLDVPEPESSAPITELAPPPGMKGANTYYPSMDPKNLGAKLT